MLGLEFVVLPVLVAHAAARSPVSVGVAVAPPTNATKLSQNLLGFSTAVRAPLLLAQPHD